MKKSAFFVLFFASYMLHGIAASVIFHNTGTTPSGWDQVLVEHNGNVAQVTNVVKEGSTAIKATQIYDPNYHNRYHSEVIKYDVYGRGDMGFYGFWFRLQSDWEFTSQRYNIAQFEADFSDVASCDTFIPTTMVWVRGTKLEARTNSGPLCPTSARTTTNFNNLVDVTAGVWHKVVIQANWQSDNTGYFKLWFDGTKVLERFNFPTTLQSDKRYQFRVGLYANSWHDDNQMVGTQGTRSVWFDEIGAGTTFADADPDQW